MESRIPKSRIPDSSSKKKIRITSIGAKRARDFAEQAYFPGGQTLGSCFLKVFHFENKKSYLGRVKIVPR